MHHRRKLSQAVLTWLLLLAILWQSTLASYAQSENPPNQTDSPPLDQTNPQETAPVDAAVTAAQVEAVSEAATLLAQTGVVKLIVGLKLPQPFQNEGLLSSPTVTTQRSAIAATQQNLLTSLAGQQVAVYQTYETIPYLALTADSAAFTHLSQSALVSSIQVDKAIPATLDSSVPLIGAPALWNAGYDGTGQSVVILDTGIDTTHAFFGGRVVAQACFSNAGGTGGATSLCPNGTPTQTGPGAADTNISACLYNGTQICAHGSHVAGIVGGKNATFSGVARNTNLIAIQVFTGFGNGYLSAYTSDLIKALEYVRTTLRNTYKVASVNMSLGGGSYTDQQTCDSGNSATKAAIDNLRSLGTATIIASGNNSWTNAISAPGCVSSAIAVGATTDSNGVASFSNMHAMVDLLAPGVSINSSIPGGGYANYNGTSMATPHVAGAWALIKQMRPNATVDEVLNLLVQNGVNIQDTRTGGSVTKPRIRLNTILNATPTLSINDVTVNENAGNATFTISLSQASSQAVSVNYATANNTALAGSDYTQKSGTVSILAGSTSAQVSVALSNDTTAESTESFFVNLSTPVNATIADNQGVGTINDDDPAVFNCANVTQIPQTECAALVALYNSTTGASWLNKTGWLATNTPCAWYGVTCSASRVSALAIYANQLRGTLPAQLGNLTSLQELNLHSNQLSGAIPSELGNLSNLQQILLMSNQLSGAIPATLGNLAQARVLWLHSNQLSGALPATLGNLSNLEQLLINGNSSLSGALPATLVNLNKMTTLWFSGTNLCEPTDTTFQSWLSRIANLSRSNIRCAALPTISITDVTVNENAGSATFTLSLSQASNQAVQVNYGTANNTALAGSDYTAQSGYMQFGPGSTSGQIRIAILNDTTAESTESFFVNLSAPVNATIADNQGIGTINDDDQAVATVRVRKYYDQNADGSRDDADSWLQGWTFHLYNAQNVLVTSQVSNVYGKVSFAGIAAGSYTVCEVLTAGWYNSQPGFSHATFNQPCYSFTIPANKIGNLVFGNSTTLPTLAADAQAHNQETGAEIVLSDAPTNDATSEAQPQDDDLFTTDNRWLNSADEEGKRSTIYLPVILHE